MKHEPCIPPGRKNYYARFVRKGKVFFKSLGTTSIREARRKYDELYDDAERLIAQGSKAAKSTTLGDIVRAYETAPLDISKKTKDANIRYFLRICAPDLNHGELTDAARLAVTQKAHLVKALEGCTQKNVQRYQAEQLKKRSASSVNSDVRQGRSVLSRHMRAYLKGQGIELPGNVREFVETLPLRDKRARNTGYVPLTRGTIDNIDAGLATLKAEQKDLWLIISLVRRLGLRNKEILNAKGSWIIKHPEGMAIDLRNSDEFSLKNQMEGVILLDAELAEAVKYIPKDNFLVGQGLTQNSRDVLVYKKTNKWLRAQFNDDDGKRIKGLYELRKEAGSMVAHVLGIDAARQLLRHRSVSTTKMFYASALTPSRSITMLTPKSV